MAVNPTAWNAEDDGDLICRQQGVISWANGFWRNGLLQRKFRHGSTRFPRSFEERLEGSVARATRPSPESFSECGKIIQRPPLSRTMEMCEISTILLSNTRPLRAHSNKESHQISFSSNAPASGGFMAEAVGTCQCSPLRFDERASSARH